MNILVLGLSNIFLRRFKFSIEKNKFIDYFDCASISKTKKDLKSFKLRNFYNSYEISIKESDAEIVYISTRNVDHYNLILKSLKYDKHVIVDKPSVINYKEANEIFKIANKRNLCVSEAIVYKYHPQITQTKNIFLENNVKPKHISAVFTMPGFERTNFRYYKKYGGGAILDLGPYAMSLGSIIFESEPISCVGYKFNDSSSEVETSFSVIIKYKAGCSLTGYFGFKTEYMNSFTAYGKDINIKLDRVFTIPENYVNQIFVNKNNKLSKHTVASSDIFYNYLCEVINSVNNNNWKNLNQEFLNNSKLLDLLKSSLK